MSGMLQISHIIVQYYVPLVIQAIYCLTRMTKPI